ncbi:terminase small subunit [Halomonas sp. WWR20]
MGLNGTQAAVRAGYSEKNASSSITQQVRQKTPVQEAIQEQVAFNSTLEKYGNDIQRSDSRTRVDEWWLGMGRLSPTIKYRKPARF